MTVFITGCHCAINRNAARVLAWLQAIIDIVYNVMESSACLFIKEMHLIWTYKDHSVRCTLKLVIYVAEMDGYVFIGQKYPYEQQYGVCETGTHCRDLKVRFVLRRLERGKLGLVPLSKRCKTNDF